MLYPEPRSERLDRIERLDRLERLLAARPVGYQTGELARALGVGPDTIRRDLDFLESRGTGLVKNGRRYLLDHRRAIHTLRLTTDQALALYLAARLLTRHSDEHNPHAAAALDRLADALATRTPELARHILLAAQSVRARAAQPAYVAALETLTRGWIERRKVRLTYRAITTGDETTRTFAPYYLEPSAVGLALYAIGHDDLRGELRTLKVERIAAAALTAEPFAIPADFDPARLLESAWGVMWGEEGGHPVTLRFAPAVARRVKESLWHRSQRIEDQPDGGCLFTVRVAHTLELKPWVRQWGPNVQVLAPPAFRAELAAEAAQMAALYRSEDKQ